MQQLDTSEAHACSGRIGASQGSHFAGPAQMLPFYCALRLSPALRGIPWDSVACEVLEQAEKTHTVDPQTFQASTAAELTFGKDKAHQMLSLKRGDKGGAGNLAQPQNVTGD